MNVRTSELREEWMAFEFNGQSVETTASGYLVNQEDWSEDLARAMAEAEEVGELTERHWDVLNYLRDEYFENRENQPNTRAIIKAMSEKWGEKIKQDALYALFPLDPSKQGGRIAGLPESRRKGGY
jgi:TusE/DsrC/DsvC family sulfur relay protein